MGCVRPFWNRLLTTKSVDLDASRNSSKRCCVGDPFFLDYCDPDYQEDGRNEHSVDVLL